MGVRLFCHYLSNRVLSLYQSRVTKRHCISWKLICRNKMPTVLLTHQTQHLHSVKLILYTLARLGPQTWVLLLERKIAVPTGSWGLCSIVTSQILCRNEWVSGLLTWQVQGWQRPRRWGWGHGPPARWRFQRGRSPTRDHLQYWQHCLVWCLDK